MAQIISRIKRYQDCRAYRKARDLLVLAFVLLERSRERPAGAAEASGTLPTSSWAVSEDSMSAAIAVAVALYTLPHAL
jgi:hypothetical protein